MKRVLEVVYEFDYGGIRAFIMNYLKYLDKDKFHVDIYAFGCSGSPFVKQVEDLGARIFFEPENNVRKIGKFVGQLKTFMKKNGPYDVVHANNNLISAWVLLAAKLSGVPIRLSHSHSTGHFSGSFVQKAYCYFRRFMIDCFATEKLACGKLAGEAMYGKHSKFEIIANGISMERFMHCDEKRIEELRHKLNIPKGAKLYANVTRMDSGKNHIFAVEVFREIHKIEPSAIFLYGGVTPNMLSTVDEVRAKIDEYGLTDFCRYTGPIMDVEQLYHMTDLWIYCSKYEGLPFGPIELQAASIPLLASDVITKEIDLGLGLVHFLSLNDSPKEWAELAVKIKKEKIQERDILEVFRKYNFDILQGVKKLESIYEGINVC